MSSTSLLGGLFHRGTHTPSPQKASGHKAPPNDPSRPKSFTIETDNRKETVRPAPPPVSAPIENPQPDVGEAVNLVHQIREALTPQGDYLSIPAAAVLKTLPDALHGPQWPGEAPTEVHLMLDREPLLEKLRSGVIRYPLGEFLPDLPEGWVVSDPQAEVTLDLPTVVKAIPPTLFGAAPTPAPLADDSTRDYFTPAPSNPPPSAEETAAPPPYATETEPVPDPRDPLPDEALRASASPSSDPGAHHFGTGTGPKRRIVPVHIPGAWNGIEAPCRASVNAVDINHATLDELQTLPGIGPDRARMILDDRTRNGRFDGIYDLLRIRGIGRKRFTHITGLSLRRRDRRDRHEVLNTLIGLPADARPDLNALTRQMADHLSETPCTLIAQDGELLATSAANLSEQGLRAAVVPMLFRRTGRYLKDLAPGASDCVALPMADPPMLLCAIDRFFLMLESKDSATLESITPQAIAIAQELSWLLGPRAMVGRATE